MRLRNFIEDVYSWQAVSLLRMYRGALLLHLLDAYASGYTQMLEGCSERMPVAELAGGARIRHIFREIFMKGLDKLNPARYVSFLANSILAKHYANTFAYAHRNMWADCCPSQLLSLCLTMHDFLKG